MYVPSKVFLVDFQCSIFTFDARKVSFATTSCGFDVLL